jgi:ribosomal protein S18 acetylase RimI-like enzyme
MTPELVLDTPRLRVRPPGPDAAREIQGVLDAATAYHVLTEGAPARAGAGADLLADAEVDPERVLRILWPRAGGPALGLLDLQLHWPDPGAVHVRLLLLREGAQGQGLGREVVTALAEALRGAGFAALRLSVTGQNTAAHAFWERMGFAAVDWLEDGVTVYERVL